MNTGKKALAVLLLGDKLIEFLNRVRRDARKHVMEPGERIDFVQFARAHKLRRIAMVFPPRSLPRKVQLRLPTAMPHRERSVRLLSMERSPSSRYLVSASQFLSR